MSHARFSRIEMYAVTRNAISGLQWADTAIKVEKATSQSKMLEMATFFFFSVLLGLGVLGLVELECAQFL